MLLICQLLSIALLVTGVARAGIIPPTLEGDDLESLCRNKTIRLTQLSHLDKLIKKLDDDFGGECLENTEAALRDLKDVVDSNRHYECTMQAYERYRAFYLRYLDTSDKDKEKTFVKLPRSLREFSIAYGVQLSGMCRVNMVNRLLDEGQKLVKEEDFDEVKELIDQNGPLGVALGYTGNKPDEIVLPSDFIMAYNLTQTRKEKIGIKVRTTPLIKRIQILCERRFKPIYVPLMLPVARMANLGFEHRKGVLKDTIMAALKDKSTSDIIGRWTRVSFMCEILNTLQLVEPDEARRLSEGNDATQVHIVGPEDMDAEDRLASGRNLLDEVEVRSDDIEQVVFKPKLTVDIPNSILSGAGQRRAVAMVKTDRDEIAIIRARFLTKLVRRLWKDLSRYKWSSLMGYIYKEIKSAIKQMKEEREAAGLGQQPEAGSTEAIKNDLVGHINAMVDSEFNPDRAVAKGGGMGLEGNQKYLVYLMIGAVAILAVLALWNGASMATWAG